MIFYRRSNITTNREYKSDPKICSDCPFLSQCTLSKNRTKVVTRHIWTKYVEETDHLRRTPEIREIYKKRKKLLREFSPTLKNDAVCDIQIIVVLPK